MKPYLYQIIDEIKLMQRNKRFGINHRFCDIPLGVNLPDTTKFIHKGLGVVIAKGSKIGNNVMIYQHVTLGGRGVESESNGAPIIEDGVKLYAYSCVLGNVTVGRNSVIGAYGLVLADVPHDAIIPGGVWNG